MLCYVILCYFFLVVIIIEDYQLIFFSYYPTALLYYCFCFTFPHFPSYRFGLCLLHSIESPHVCICPFNVNDIHEQPVLPALLRRLSDCRLHTLCYRGTPMTYVSNDNSLRCLSLTALQPACRAARPLSREIPISVVRVKTAEPACRLLRSAATEMSEITTRAVGLGRTRVPWPVLPPGSMVACGLIWPMIQRYLDR